MSPIRKKRFKTPVLSRLMQAWLIFAVISASLGAYVIFGHDQNPARVELAVEGIDRLAQPAARVAPPERLNTQQAATTPTEVSRMDAAEGPDADPAAHQIRPSRPGVLDPYASNVDDMEANDMLGGGDSAPVYSLRNDDEIVITIDGASAKSGSANIRNVDRPTPRHITLASVDPALSKKSAYGPVPVVGVDGRRAADIYARPYAPSDAPIVGLIVGGLGLNRTLTERAIYELPPEVTLAFAPYAKELPYWVGKAREAGHEVLIEIPMEQRGGDATGLGPAALMTSRTPEENAQRLDWLMSRFEGYVGATNYLGARFAGDRAAMRPVLQKLRQAGLVYFDDTGLMGQLGEEPGRDIAVVNRVIKPDYNGGQQDTARDLETLERVARRDGSALGKTYAYAETIDGLAAWANGLRDMGLEIAPASAVLKVRRKET